MAEREEDILEKSRAASQSTAPVEKLPARNRSKAEQEWDTGFDLKEKAFEGATRVLEYRPPGLAPGKPGLKFEMLLNVIGSEDITDFEREVDKARFRATRISQLTIEWAKCDDPGDPDDLENDPGDETAQQIRDEIDVYKAKPGVMTLSINSVIIPTVVRWNMKVGGIDVPLEADAIAKQVPLTVVNGLTNMIIKEINKEQPQGRKSKRH